jgi:glyoxylase-like metal-dependent hydrolase (beta-lactamase superfamily II)
VVGFPSAVFGTNCYVIAPGRGEECIVVDPGIEVAPTVSSVVETHGLRPVAVLLTHGHLDHIFSVVPVAGARGIPAYIHPDDRELLADPMRGVSAEVAAMFGPELVWTEPDDVRELTDASVVEIAGLVITVDHAPGHTPGSVMFRLPGSPATDDQTYAQTLLSGDVLFAGSIGRTDLPGGSSAAMVASLAAKVVPLADDTLVLPGHGGSTTIAHERETNPYLAGVTSTAASRGK